MRDIELRRRERQWIDRERGRESHTHRHDDDDCDDEAEAGCLDRIAIELLQSDCQEPDYELQ